MDQTFFLGVSCLAPGGGFDAIFETEKSFASAKALCPPGPSLANSLLGEICVGRLAGSRAAQPK